MKMKLYALIISPILSQVYNARSRSSLASSTQSAFLPSYAFPDFIPAPHSLEIQGLPFRHQYRLCARNNDCDDYFNDYCDDYCDRSNEGELSVQCKAANTNTRPKLLSSRRKLGKQCILTAAALATTSSTQSSLTANAITPEQASQQYDTYASTYDNLDGGKIASSLGIDEARQTLLQLAKGDVLEIGCGTGLNLASYQFCTEENGKNGENGKHCVTSLTLVDISDNMLAEARQRVDALGLSNMGIPVKFVKADATSELTSLFGGDKFDTVVDTFSLCVMGNDGAKKCLSEMKNVVKSSGSGGQILLIENTRASNPLLGFYQDITATTAADVGGKGCVYNQNVGDMISQTRGLQLVKEEAFAAGLFRSFVCQKV